ncbi:response regulator [Chryseolinea soli]|uniref:Response regulator n=1 Tax=Chryseolinea soli TaxID=2321403 RepID=A0A385SWY5_9BACT|nr:response regulator [Chryseolinea soli]AYB34637.1 response regulator [Chryseolinea soli]
MKNVLLVDDDAVFNFLSKKVVERLGVATDIHTALNGREALDLFNSYYQGAMTLPDIILLDLNMPVMDGFSFLEAFNRLEVAGKERVKIVVVTSSHDPRDMERTKKLGVTDYLTKPLQQKKLQEVLEV